MLLLFSIGLLLLLILWFRLNAFIALIVTALCTGLAHGMAPTELLKSIQNGIGSTLGGLVLVLALGIMLGSILGETGAIQVISNRLLRFFGAQHANWAMALTGFLIGIAMFYNAGFVILAPLVFSVASASGKNLISLAISMAAPLSVTHGFLPPHPGATAIANLFEADLGKTLVLGLIIAIPAVLLAGIVFPKYALKNISAKPPAGLTQAQDLPQAELPGFAISMYIAMQPVLLMAAATFLEFTLKPEDSLYWAKLWGDPGVAMLLAVLAGLFFLSQNRVFSPNQRLRRSDLIEKSNTALGAAASLLLIIAAGGAFKQVLVDSGLGQDVATSLLTLPVSPLFLGWSIATLLRIAVGSATVAGMTAAGIVQPLMAVSGASPELMTLAIGAGSLMCSHVNDTGFWMFKAWFGLSLRDTFLSWTLMETIVGLSGLAGVLLLDFCL